MLNKKMLKLKKFFKKKLRNWREIYFNGYQREAKQVYLPKEKKIIRGSFNIKKVL